MEILVGISILGIVYATLFGLMSTSLRNVTRIETREKIIRYAQMKLNEVALYASQGQANQPLSGKFDEKFQWVAQIEPYDLGEGALSRPPFEVARVRLSVVWPGRDQQNRYTLETLTWIPNEDGDQEGKK